jgi:hypothetical protein
MAVAFVFLAEGAGQPREALNARSHRQVLTFDVGSADVIFVSVSADHSWDRLHNFSG